MQALSIAREIGHKLSEGNQLGNLAIVYKDQGRVRVGHRALYAQAIAIARETGDKRSEGIYLGNLAIAHRPRAV